MSIWENFSWIRRESGVCPPPGRAGGGGDRLGCSDRGGGLSPCRGHTHTGLGAGRAQVLSRVRDGGRGLAGPTWRPQSQTMLYIICVTQKQCRKLWKGLFL